jgi:hypothetical protein
MSSKTKQTPSKIKCMSVKRGTIQRTCSNPYMQPKFSSHVAALFTRSNSHGPSAYFVKDIAHLQPQTIKPRQNRLQNFAYEPEAMATQEDKTLPSVDPSTLLGAVSVNKLVLEGTGHWLYMQSCIIIPYCLATPIVRISASSNACASKERSSVQYPPIPTNFRPQKLIQFRSAAITTELQKPGTNSKT